MAEPTNPPESPPSQPPQTVKISALSQTVTLKKITMMMTMMAVLQPRATG
jgi:hypothetical protein